MYTRGGGRLIPSLPNFFNVVELYYEQNEDDNDDDNGGDDDDDDAERKKSRKGKKIRKLPQAIIIGAKKAGTCK